MTRRRTAKGRRGAALFELVLSLGVISIAVLGVFTVAAGGARSQGELDDEEWADESVRVARDVLSQYVTPVADTTTVSYAPNGSWALPGDDNCTWALQLNCEHTASQFLDSRLLTKFTDPKPRMTYRVEQTDPDTPFIVTFRVTR